MTVRPDTTLGTMIADPVGADREVLLTGGTVVTMDPALGTVRDADVLLRGDRISGIGHRLRADADAVTVDARGATVVPLFVDSALPRAPGRERHGFTRAPGNAATLAVVRGAVDDHRISRMLVVSPRDLRAVLVDGRLVAWTGAPTRPAGSDGHAADDPRLGAWVDAPKALEQYLTADGRYSETRDGRTDAYTGRFWLDGDRITYLDDLGFWAFGQFVDGVLHHAGFVMRRRTEP